MTPQQFHKARLKLGLTQAQLAEKLRVSDGRTIRYWESGEREIPGPVIVCMEMFLEKAK